MNTIPQKRNYVLMPDFTQQIYLILQIENIYLQEENIER